MTRSPKVALACPDCRRHRKKFGSAKDRKFYATGFGIQQLRNQPELAALILAEKFRLKERRFLARWAALCWSCRNEFAESHGLLLERCIASLTLRISTKVTRAERAAAELNFFHGSASGVLEYIRRVHKEAQERMGMNTTVPGYVYAIRSGRHLKIGFARNLEQRLNALQVSSPREIELIGSVTGYPQHERTIQGRFAEYHVRGEWFKDCEAIRRFFANTISIQPRRTSNGARTLSK